LTPAEEADGAVLFATKVNPSPAAIAVIVDAVSVATGQHVTLSPSGIVVTMFVVKVAEVAFTTPVKTFPAAI
jgi:hypothetical protein